MKVLLLCESFSPRLSGGKVVRYLYKILTNHGHDVHVAVTGGSDGTMDGAYGDCIHLLPSPDRLHRFFSLWDRADVPTSLKTLTESFRPDVVHFASFDHTKSANLYDYFKFKGVRTILQPWTMHFYCAQGFGYLRHQNCTRCIHEGLLPAFRHSCAGPRGMLGQLELAALRRTVPKAADVVLSSNYELDKILVAYGFASASILRFPIAFDVEMVRPVEISVGDYYIFYGQAVSHKGIDFVIDLFSSLPEKRLKVFPMATFKPSRALPANIEILNGFGWANGLREAIAGAKAVLIPSLWITSTEYSLCEAMTMKKPVVAFGRGAHQELLVDRESAMVVRAGDQVDFARALNELERDPLLYQRLAAGGAARIAEVNGPTKLHAQLMSAYQPETDR